MLKGTIATALEDLTLSQLEEWLEGNPTTKEERAIRKELASRRQRIQEIADLLW